MKDQLIAIVTGAAKGIGKAISQRLQNDGYFVIMIDVEKDLSINTEMEAYYGCDISKENEVKQLFSSIKENYKHIDLLVNNAGIIKDNLIWNQSSNDFDAVINVNLRGTWLMCKEAAIVMKEQQKGRIVNIASRAWLGNKGQSNYSASKAGIIGLTRVLALELGKYNVLVNAIAPGLIDTPLTQGLKQEVLEQLIKTQPTQSIGNPDDVAHAVSFLGSYSTQFITGQTLYVDGGKSIGAGGF